MRPFAGIALASALATAASAATPDLTGVWWPQQKSPAVHPIEGGQIPFTAAGAAAYATNRPLIKQIDGALPTVTDMKRCVPNGTPRVWGSGFPVQIMQPEHEVVIAYEKDHIRRFVYLDQKADPDPDPSYMGSSVGRWDGETLVVDSAAFKPTFLDDTGLPHGDKLHITERLRKINGGKTLEVRATLDDPEMYAKPWTVQYLFSLRPDERIRDYLCGIGVVQTRFGTQGAIPKLKHHGS
jgi:hypothetical protein